MKYETAALRPFFLDSLLPLHLVRVLRHEAVRQRVPSFVKPRRLICLRPPGPIALEWCNRLGRAGKIVAVSVRH